MEETKKNDKGYHSKPLRVKDEVKKFFNVRFKEVEEDQPYLDGVKFNRISPNDNMLLLAMFEEEKVKEVVWSCESSKCLGLDDFNVKFIKAFWDIMKMDVMRFLGEFHRNGVFPKGSQSGGGKQVGRL